MNFISIHTKHFSKYTSARMVYVSLELRKVKFLEIFSFIVFFKNEKFLDEVVQFHFQWQFGNS